MTIKELCEKTDFEIVSGAELCDREVTGVYACDLLSWVIGRAKEKDALVTVMTNMNVIAVAVMADLSCVVLAEGVKLDENAAKKAVENDVPVLSSKLPAYETCILLSKALS